MRTQAVSNQETGLFVEIAATLVAFSTSHLLGRSQQHFPDIVQLDGQLTVCGDLPVYKACIIKNTSGFQHIEDSSAYFVLTRKRLICGYVYQCRSCPLRAQCLQKADQKSPRSVVFFYKQVVDRQKPDAVQMMKNKIDSPPGKRIYGKRLAVAEPPFAHMQEM